MNKKQDEVTLNSADVKHLEHLIDNLENTLLDISNKAGLSSAHRLAKYLKEVLK